MNPLLRRLLSPAGFLLVLLLFLLPFVSISCEFFGGEISADYSGLDVAVNGEPTTSIPAGLDELSPGRDDPSDGAPTTNAQLWAILTAAMALAGLLTVLVSAVRARMVAAAAAAGLALVLLVVSQIVAQSNLSAELLKQAKELDSGPFDFSVSEDIVDSLVGWEIGFLLAMLVLLALLLGNVGALTRDRWRRFVPKLRRQPASPPPDADLVTPPMGIPLPAEPEKPKDS